MLGGRFSRRVLAILQFTRFALVFTAISNAQAAILLAAGRSVGRAGDSLENEASLLGAIDARLAGLMLVVSCALYAFGMCLNDIVDRRRDATLAAERPLPSGRIGGFSAHLVCGLTLAVALAAGATLAQLSPQPPMRLILLLGTITLIVFYDVAGKYLVAPGLITLGLIRFFHIALADPTLAVPWHGLLMFNHVAILSAVAYALEDKRPRLRRMHVALLSAMIVGVNALLVGLLIWRRVESPATMLDDLAITRSLAWPAAMAAAFLVLAVAIVKSGPDARTAGKKLMLAGLLWLIVYDAAFVASSTDLWLGLALLMLLPVSWACVLLMRAGQRLMLLSKPPQYLRAR